MGKAAKAHGMDGTLVEPDWAPLTLTEVRELLKQFPECGKPTEILSVSPRPFSAASVVATQRRRPPEERIFVKRHALAVRDREGLHEEHRFMAHLLSHGAQVPRVLADASGETAIERGEWCYEVHEAPEGADLYGDALSWTPFKSVGHARAAGAALARLHLAAEGFKAPPREHRQLVAGFTIFAAQDPREEMDRYVAARPVLQDYLLGRTCCDEALTLLTPFHAELRPLLPSLQPLWTHNDLHASNLLWSDVGENARAVAVIDFGLADRTNAVHDLAQAIERNIVDWLALTSTSHGSNVHVDFDALTALLDGYESVRRLSIEEAAAIAPMTALCHAEFALSETDYFLSVLHAPEKAPFACEGWLVGHARWFHGPDGTNLLDTLRRWAWARMKIPEQVHLIQQAFAQGKKPQ